MSYLAKIMERNGVKFASRSGSNWQAHCWLHKDDNPSLSVDVTQDIFQCFSCKAKGNLYSYMTEHLAMKPKDAIEEMKENNAWKGEQDYNYVREYSQPKEAAKIDEVPPKHKGLHKIEEHDYRNEKGRIKLKVVRYASLVGGEAKKTFLQLTPSGDGSWYMCNPTNRERLPKGVGCKKIPLYRQEELAREGVVIFVEGEKCADAVNDVHIDPKLPQPIGVCVAGGSSAVIAKHDLSPLFQRDVIVIADSDDAGRKFARKIGRILYKEQKCDVRYVMPEGEDGYDIADALNEGGWDNGLRWIENSPRHRHPLPDELEEVETLDVVASAMEDIDPIEESLNFKNREELLHNNEHFRVIGFDPSGTEIAFYIKGNNTTVWYRPAALMGQGTMLHLAPDNEWWSSLCSKGKMTSSEKNVIVSLMIKNAIETGIVKQVNTYGRGACMTDEHNVIFHLGDRYLCDPVDGKFTSERSLEDVPGKVILEPDDRIEIVSSDQKHKQYCKDLYNALLAYRFLTETDARVLMGWMVSSIVGGALEHRPNIWLSAPASTGKTFLITKVLSKFFGDMFYSFADPTPAGISQKVRSQSIGIVIDEFEPEQQNEDSMRKILSMMRSATGGTANIARGSSEGRANLYHPRFSTMLVSILKPDLKEADASRLVSCRLSRTGVSDFNKVRDDIVKATTTERMSVIRSAIIYHTPEIVDRVKELVQEMEVTTDMNTRSIQIHGALTAGACWLGGDNSTTFRKDGEGYDDAGYAMLKIILSSSIRILGTPHDMTISKMLYSIHHKIWVVKDVNSSLENAVVETLNYLGVRFWYDSKQCQDVLLIAKGMPGMQALIKKSPMPSIQLSSLSESLLHIEGTYEPRSRNEGYTMSTFGEVRKRAIAIPFAVLKQAGFSLEEESETTAVDELAKKQYDETKENEEFLV